MHLRPATSALKKSPAIAVLISALLTTTAVEAAPAIRMSDDNRVPACVTPGRLMDFVADRNERLDPRYRDIAQFYKHYGEAWNVRWDYAFFQMILETNYLKYRRGDGRRGDVREMQNNFAGIGATGGGVAGERFADIKTGVHAQIQHLVAYSGERVMEPVARRTRENQDDIIDKSRRLRRPVTFGDLARRWAADRQYARSIDTVAGLFKENYCNRQQASVQTPPQPVPAVRPAIRPASFKYSPPSHLGGPQEQMRLAGPDNLPWAGAPPAASAGAASKPEAQVAPEKEAAPKRKSPVRTIWTREDGEIDVPTANAPISNVPATNAPAAAAVAPPAAQPAPPAAAGTVAESKPSEMSGSADAGAPAPLPRFKIMPSAPEPSKLGGPVDTAPAATLAQAANCHVQSASYGGKKTLLLRTVSGSQTQYTALTVLDGFEKTMVDTFAKAHAISVEVVGEYQSKQAALADANANCGG